MTPEAKLATQAELDILAQLYANAQDKGAFAYAARILTNKSWVQIARAMGVTDHTTAIYHCKRHCAQHNKDFPKKPKTEGRIGG